MPQSVRTDETEVREAIARYIKATYEADVKGLRVLFYSNASMHGYLGDKLITGTPEPFFRDMTNMPSLKSTGIDYQAKITELTLAPPVASVTLEETGFGPFSFVNLLHLLKVHGEWKIVSKTFTTRQIPPSSVTAISPTSR